ncbi:hypothetical protein PYW07_017014 [Mythimna separata]|uniref:Uncharacterized protein n=1 Tax=Mythimna separata TaxID=271217 RepID=A0AAD7YVL0_MYTSE|nr:hypothetical protein PYW07_017014 [Mythimna separata]
MKKWWLFTKILRLHYLQFRSGQVNLNGVERALKTTPAPSDYFLFPNLKKDLRGKHFSDDEELKGAINEHFSGHEEKNFLEGIEKLLSRTNKCIEMLGEYIEK